MRRKLLGLLIGIFVSQNALAWHATGHKAVAAIAWNNMTAAAQQKAVDMLMKAPANACLLDLFSNDSRPLDVRQREFFILAATWSDIIRPQKDKTGKPDPRPCVQFHQPDWHFFDHFWSGTSGATGGNAPKDRPDIPQATTNAVERMEHFRPIVACATSPCPDPPEQQAMDLAWMLHLAGDIHQPLHNAGRVTTVKGEEQGDRGGNLFLLDKNHGAPNLHFFWDHIVDDWIPQKANEGDLAYIDRVAAKITKDHPKSSITDLKSGDVNAWSEEGFATAKRIAYPASLKRGKVPNGSYRTKVFKASDEAIAIAGYRLADLLNSTFK